MGLIESVKRVLGAESEPEPVHLYSCNDCGNVFTTAARAGEEEATCPNCDSTDVEVTVE